MKPVLVKVKLRRHLPVKKEAESLDGKMFILYPAWIQGDEEKYPREWALFRYRHKEFAPGISWIASGDVEVLSD